MPSIDAVRLRHETNLPGRSLTLLYGFGGSQFLSKLFRNPERWIEPQFASCLSTRHSAVILGDVVDPGSPNDRRQCGVRSGIYMDRIFPKKIG